MAERIGSPGLVDPTPLSIAQAQIVALNSRQHQLEVMIKELIRILARSYTGDYPTFPANRQDELVKLLKQEII